MHKILPFLGFIATLTACERDHQLPNVVFVTIDTLRADRLGTYGYFRDTSPVLDDLAEQSLVFERCYAPMATTFPSHLSLFSSTYRYETCAIANRGAGGAKFVPTPYLESLPGERLRKLLLERIELHKQRGAVLETAGQTSEEDLDRKILEQLRALGYVQ